MLIETITLVGRPLAWAVAKCVGIKVRTSAFGSLIVVGTDGGESSPFDRQVWSPATDHAQGGPIMDQFLSDLVIQQDKEGEGRVHAYINSNKKNEICRWGPTSLIATMRVVVASNMGEHADVPEEFL